MARGNAKELRLGLVCYGGSSLAIYMHGISKEIHRLVKASALLDAGVAASEPSEKVYADLLQALGEAGSGSVNLRVIVDVIAGTSAGGINGIYLAKALAGNGSLDALRDLWFVRGDMNELVIGPRKLLGWTVPLKLKLPWIARRALTRSPLRGDDMSRWLYQALETMDAVGRQPRSLASLLPAAHPLDLFVTITDFYGYQRLIPLAWPRFVSDARHRHALNFRYEGGASAAGDVDDFGDNAGLAFAARTTSCFPAVFPPVNPSKFSAAIGAPVTALLDRCFRIYKLSGADPDKTYFVDGGVLDNKPFGWATDTIIHDRPAESEVDRRLLYIEPDPAGLAPRQGGDDPETLTAAVGALSSIPRSEPILDDLLGVQVHNEQVARIRDVVEANFAGVAGQVAPLVDIDTLTHTSPSAWPWSNWNEQVHALAIGNAGISYTTYLRVKISSVADGLAEAVCAVCAYPDESNQAYLVRETIRAWARGHGLFAGLARDQEAEPCADRGSEEPRRPVAPGPTAGQIAFLQAFDLGFMRRRLRFLVAGLNWWYRCVDEPAFPARADLDQGKAIVYRAIATLDALARLQVDEGAPESVQRDADALRRQVMEVFDEAELTALLTSSGVDGEAYAAAHRDVLDRLFAHTQAFFGARLDLFAPSLLSELAQVTARWERRRMRDVVVRYLGFPIWDVLLYPIQALTQVGEGDKIDVVRVSPREASLLSTPTGGKVEGARLGHFYAFFSREARENDYLWGRLDAAEQLIRLVIDAGKGNEPVEHWSKEAFTAVLAEDGAELTTIAGKVAALSEEIGRIGKPPPPPGHRSRICPLGE